MGLVEIAIFALNEYVQLDMLRVGEVDVVLEEVDAEVNFPNWNEKLKLFVEPALFLMMQLVPRLTFFILFDIADTQIRPN